MDPAQQLRLVWGYRWWIALVAIAAGVGGYFLSSAGEAEYRASSVVQVVSGRQASGEFVSEAELAHLTNVYAEMARTWDIAESAAERSQDEAATIRSRIEVLADPQLAFLRIRGTASTASDAATLAAVYADAFSDFVDDQEDAFRDERLQRVGVRLREIQLLLDADPSDGERLALETELQGLQTRAADLQAQAPNAVRIVQQARPPGSPASPQPKRDAALAFFLALSVAVGLAYVRVSMSDRYRTPEEAAEDLRLPLLSRLPRGGDDDPNVSESFRRLRTSIVFALREVAAPVVLVTSAVPGSGKTFTTIHLGRAFAADGRRAVTVDGDLRKPSLHARLGLPISPGLGELLSSNGSGSELQANDAAMPQSAGQRGGDLDVITAGVRLDDPPEALASDRMSDAILALRETYDVVVLDSPPALAVVDPVILSRLADGVVVVVDLRRDHRRNARRAVDTLRAVEAPLIGVVVNGAADVEGYGYYDEAPRSRVTA